MKKQKLNRLKLNKKSISNLKEATIKGGVSGLCTSSIVPLECPFACPDTVGGQC